MSMSSIRKWLIFLGIVIFAVGLTFMIIEELTSYKTISMIMMVVGIVIIIISNFFRRRSHD
ncbi:hypothetical protein SAMN04488688_107100 [Paenibacillus sp. cl141a]|nr:hypothetical protein SAMN04488688_107100 [Paenibacillus sp. cl141a]